MPVSQADIDLAGRLADAAGAAIRPYFRTEHGLESKDDASPVTLADKAAEAAMRRLIIAERPMDAIIGEEEDDRPGTSGRTWVLDPIDGTRSFIAGRPIFGTLIALLEDGWPVLGIIDQPIIKERWLGVTGRETLFNGKPAHARTCRELSKALLATTSPALFTDGQLHAFEHVDAAVMSTVLGGDCYNYGLDHQVEMAGGDEAVIIAVAAQHRAHHRGIDMLEGMELAVGEQGWRGGGEQCL